ncbi:MAG: hypothetical protein ACYC55_00665 [Candidatus Geothermincolia bacterium]
MEKIATSIGPDVPMPLEKAANTAWRRPVAFLIAGFFLFALATLAPDPVIGKMSPIQPALENNRYISTIMRWLGLAEARFIHLVLLGAVAMAVLLGAYYVCMRRAKTERLTLRFILGVAAACCLLLVLTPPILSRDLFAIGFYGRISVFHHANPYLVTPQRFVGSDAMLPFLSTNWKNTPMVYGPVVWLFSVMGAFISRGNIVAHLTFLKLVLVASHLVNVYVIWRILGRLAPERQAFGTVMYAWLPPVIMLTVGGGHYDSLMLTFALCALMFLLEDRPMAGFAMLTISVLVKFVTVVPLLLYLLLVLKRADPRLARREALRYGAVGAGISLLFFLPLLTGGLSIFRPMLFTAGKTNVVSLRWVLAGALRPLARSSLGLSPDSAELVAAMLAAVVMWALYLLIFRRIALRYPAPEQQGEAWALAMFAFIVTVGYVLPWYMIWFLPFVPLMPWERRAKWILVCGIAGMFLALDLWP